MIVGVEDQNGSSFADNDIAHAILRCKAYACRGDVFRIYVQDAENPYPGFIAVWVSMDREGVIRVRPNYSDFNEFAENAPHVEDTTNA